MLVKGKQVTGRGVMGFQLRDTGLDPHGMREIPHGVHLRVVRKVWLIGQGGTLHLSLQVKIRTAVVRRKR
jgi:hypothetical protein